MYGASPACARHPKLSHLKFIEYKRPVKQQEVHRRDVELDASSCNDQASCKQFAELWQSIEPVHWAPRIFSEVKSGHICDDCMCYY